MTHEELVRRYWYNRMMNVTARGYNPVAFYNDIPPKPASKWSWTFSEDCPQDFIDLFNQQCPEPNFIANPEDPEHGTWGEVSVWHEFMKTGYINILNYDRFDTRSLTFSYDVMKDGKTIKMNAFTITAIKTIQLRSHLRELWLDGYDPQYEGLEVVLDNLNGYSMFGACSSARAYSYHKDRRANNYHGRNFDFIYDDKQTYLIHVRNTNQTYAFNCIVKDMFKEGTYTRLLPNMAVDGINQNGVCVNINVVSKKDLDSFGQGYENKKGTKPGATKVHMLVMPSVILAKATSAVHALELMHQYDIYGDLVGLEHVHFMISDKWDTFVVEVIGDQLKVLGFSLNWNNDCGYVTEVVTKYPAIMTNWYQYYHRFPSWIRGKYTPNSCGIERFDLLYDQYTTHGFDYTEQWMIDLMMTVRFTNQVLMNPSVDMYYPFSDFGFGAEQSTQENYLDNEEFRKKVDAEIDKIKIALLSEDRTKGIWITSHSVVYDINMMSMRLVFEEDYEHPMRFGLWLRDN